MTAVGPPSERATREILLVRYYLHLAKEQLRMHGPAPKFAAINLLHEALEVTLIACSDHLNATVSERATISQYLDAIDARLGGRNLPLRRRVLQFNRSRVSAKHHLTLPGDDHLIDYSVLIPEFIDGSVYLTFGQSIDSFNLIDLIEDEKVTGFLRASQSYLSDGKYFDCLVEARKAFYLQFEQWYDISQFSDPEKAKQGGVLGAFSMCRAPSFAKNPEHIEKYVSRPSSYIVFDHSKIDSDLIKDGVDVQIFWNIWRLMPKIFQRADGQWAVEIDFDIADDPDIKQNCVYVLDNLVNILLQVQQRRKKSKSKPTQYRYVQVRSGTPFYRKAHAESETVGVLPDGVRRVNVEGTIPALDGSGIYWEASYLAAGGPWMFGFVRDRDVESAPQVGYVSDGTNIGGAISGYLPDDSHG